MKKIYVDKSDSIAAITEKVLSASDEFIVLYIPRFSKMASSSQNFRLLKREIDASGKDVEIESVDDEALELAKAVGIKATNPFFKKNRKAVSDILVPQDRRVEDEVVLHHHNEEIPEEEERVRIDEVELETERESHKRGVTLKERTKYTFKAPSIRLNIKNPVKVFLGSIILSAIIVGAFIMLPRADIRVVLEKHNWDFSGSMLASALIKESYFSNGQVKVGGAVFEKTKNLTETYPATGSENISRKASGKIIIYNAFSSEPQPLIANTRFSAPDGKVFRIQKGITVPGAKIVNNKIVPSTIEATVFADQPGSEYNIEPTRFRIPGLQGSPKYDGFYAESKEPMAGGSLGISRVPTDGDIVKAKERVRKTLENVLKSELAINIPEDIKIITNASRFVVVKEEVDQNVDEAGEFGVTVHGTLKLFGFKESDLIKVFEREVVDELLVANPGEVDISLSLKESSITYGEPRIDFDKKDMSSVIKFKSVWTREFDLESFTNAILKKKPSEIEESTKSFTGIKSVGVNLWPFWVRKVPEDVNKVSIDVE